MKKKLDTGSHRRENGPEVGKKGWFVNLRIAFLCSGTRLLRFTAGSSSIEWTRSPPSPGRKVAREARGNQDGAKHWTTRPDDVPGDGSTAGWDATTGQLPATFVPSAAAAAVQFTPGEQHSATATTKSIPAFSA